MRKRLPVATFVAGAQLEKRELWTTKTGKSFSQLMQSLINWRCTHHSLPGKLSFKLKFLFLFCFNDMFESNNKSNWLKIAHFPNNIHYWQNILVVLLSTEHCTIQSMAAYFHLSFRAERRMEYSECCKQIPQQFNVWLKWIQNNIVILLECRMTLPGQLM